MNKDCVGFLLELVSSSYRIIESNSNQLNVKPLATMISDAINFEFWSDFRHENSPFYFEFVTTVSYSLRMVTRTSSDDSPCFFLLSKVKKCSTGTPQLKTSNIL